MRIKSFVQNHYQLEEVELEISLTPGVPNFSVTGLPDAVIRESIPRIKAAIRAQGFLLPQSEHVLIHLRPSHQKKSSRGLDLAIAALYLWHTEQIPKPLELNENTYVYGELTLEGRVMMPEDLRYLDTSDRMVITGAGDFATGPYLRVEDVKALQSPIPVAEGSAVTLPIRPSWPFFRFNSEAAEIMTLIAAGEHHALLAGPQGSGKTTLAECVGVCIEEPEAREWSMIQRVGHMFGETARTWRPVISPHHTTTALAFLGGGIPAVPGEVTRASGGVLILDEFLEFPTVVREALREPLEKRMISVMRKGERVTFPAEFLCVATTNLCPCGEYVPNQPRRPCRYSLHRCRSYLERFSGPLADRFDIIAYSDKWSASGEVTCDEIAEKVTFARKFARLERKQDKVNGRLSLAELERWVDPAAFKLARPERTSRRREIAELRVARTIADLEGRALVKATDMERARLVTRATFEDLKKSYL